MIGHFRGEPVEIIQDGDFILYHISIKSPYFHNGQWWYSLSDSLLKTAAGQKAKIEVKIGQKRETIKPTEELLKEKEKLGEFKEIPSKFSTLPNWKLYLFPI